MDFILRTGKHPIYKCHQCSLIASVHYAIILTMKQLLALLNHNMKNNHRLNSSLPISPLRRTLMLELLLLRRRLRLSAGSAGLNPLARACKFNTSVKLTTPTRRPDSRAPGSAEAGIEDVIGDAGT